MLTQRDSGSALAVFGAAWTLTGSAATPQKQPVQTAPNKDLLAKDQVEELLLMMDTNKNGRISKAEWMKFMADEFDRLDTDRSGELDVKEIAKSRLMATRHTSTGK